MAHDLVNYKLVGKAVKNILYKTFYFIANVTWLYLSWIAVFYFWNYCQTCWFTTNKFASLLPYGSVLMELYIDVQYCTVKLFPQFSEKPRFSMRFRHGYPALRWNFPRGTLSVEHNRRTFGLYTSHGKNTLPQVIESDFSHIGLFPLV